MKLLTTITLPQLVDVASWLARGVEHDSSSCCLMLLPLGSTLTSPSAPLRPFLSVATQSLFLPYWCPPTVLPSTRRHPFSPPTPPSIKLKPSPQVPRFGHFQWKSDQIGPEQGSFRVPREEYYRRPDLRLTGHTLIG
jgi:hypothetical protein